MFTALDKLGYKSYHMTVAARARTSQYWLEALKAKIYNIGKPWGRVEFDKLLKDFSVNGSSHREEMEFMANYYCQAVTDTPCANFPDQLVAAYPNAKVILTTRDPDKWIQSMERSIYEVLSWRVWPLIKILDPVSIHIKASFC